MTIKYLLTIRNNNGLEPLKLAAKEGCIEIFKRILDIDGVYRESSTTVGHLSVSEYDLSIIEPILCRKQASPSILELLAYATAYEESVKSFKIPLIKNIVQLKWNFYKRFYLMWIFIHFSYMLSVTSLSIGLPNPARDCYRNVTVDRISYLRKLVLFGVVNLNCFVLLIYGITGLICTVLIQRGRHPSIRKSIPITKTGRYYVFLIGKLT